MKKPLGLLLTMLVALCTSSFAASFSGTLNPPATGSTSSTITWTGNVTGVIGSTGGTGLINPVCTSTTCDIYSLTVNVPATFYAANPTYAIRVAVNWSPAAPNTDIDIYVYDSNSNLVCSGTSARPTTEDTDCGQLASGVYSVQVTPAVAVQQQYSGSISLAPEVSTVPGAITTGPARYRKGNFTFSSPVEMVRPNNVTSQTNGNPLVTFLDSDGEPRVVHDPLGNLYIAAIQGVPAGTDMWKSMDGGANWTYLGEPDGAQAANVLSGANGAGIGGGDEDLIALPNGQVVMTSLWLGSNTTCTSPDGGAAWLCNPNGSTVPNDDRQWLANNGSNIVYITSKQTGPIPGIAFDGTVSIYVAKSTDGGKTFPSVSFVTTPELGVQPGDQGNIIVDSLGNVYTVFFDQVNTNILYVAKSVDGGSTWKIGKVFAAPAGISLVHVFPSIAADKANNLYIVFSDGINSYLTTSVDGGANWKLPAIVNSGFGIKSTVEPWVVAGDAGKINIFFYGTLDTNFMDTNAQWVVYMAQSQNALAKVPTFALAPATPSVIHVGAICNNGDACPSGTRTMLEYFFPDTYLDGNAMAVYPDSVHVLDPSAANTNAWFVKQTGGNKIAGQ
ncbi:MAG: WD40/YVTN/BNR-like repeat-containing protein [Terriglobales bacterium]